MYTASGSRSDGGNLRHGSDESDTGNEASRDDERGDVAEPDAPTSIEENEGMSTVLSSDPITGVQDSTEE